MKKQLVLPILMAWGTLAPLEAGVVEGLQTAKRSVSSWFQRSPTADLEQGHELFAKGDFVGATQAYYRNVQRYRRDSKGWSYLAKAYLAAGRTDYAAQAARAAIQIDDKTEYQLLLAQVQLGGGDVLPAVENLKTIVKKDPKQDEAWTLLGRSYEAMDLDDVAKACYQRALDANPFQSEAAYLLEKWDPEAKATEPAVSSKPAALEDAIVAQDQGAQGALPKSRLFAGLPSSQTEDTQLIPLLNSYHLSSDAPHDGLKPSEVQVWEPAMLSDPTPIQAQPISKSPVAPAPELDDL